MLYISLSISLFAEEKVWYMYSTRMTENINLGDAYYLPDYTKTWSQDKSIGDPINGTYSTINTLGNFGVQGCAHKLKFTISTDGRFVSQSDPSKYRNYYLAMRPKCRIYKGGDMNYNLGSNGVDIDESDRLVNTKLTGSMTYITPPVSESGSYVRVDSKGTMKTIDRFHADLIVMMDELSSEDKQKLSELDDYFATFTISWECEENNCTNPKHFGEYTVVLRGYYGSDKPRYSLVSLFVKPTVNSSKTTSSQGFTLINRTTGKTIPYTLNVLQDGAVVGTFDGKDKSNNSKPAHYVDFSNSQSSLVDREGNTSYSIMFDGNVQIDFGNLTEDQINADLINYGGVYTSDIYYYVVTSENNYL